MVTGISPSSGPAAGGTQVTVSGSDFTGTTAVDFGTVAAAVYSVSADQITIVSPPGSGTVDVTVTTPDGTSAKGAADRFTTRLPLG